MLAALSGELPNVYGLCKRNNPLTSPKILDGKFLVESIINQLGRFSPTSGHWSWFPKISFFTQFLSPKQPQKVIGYSPSQSRLLAVLLSSCLHGMFFIIMMGSESKGGFLGFILCRNCSVLSAALLVLFVHHGRLSDQHLTSTARNAYFLMVSSGPLYVFGLWSVSHSASLEISFLTPHSFRSRWSCISPRLSDHHHYGNSLVPLLFRFFDPLGL